MLFGGFRKENHISPDTSSELHTYLLVQRKQILKIVQKHFEAIAVAQGWVFCDDGSLQKTCIELV
jgi:hypothetical protein